MLYEVITDQRETRRIADRLEQVIVHAAFTGDDRRGVRVGDPRLEVIAGQGVDTGDAAAAAAGGDRQRAGP